MKLPHKQTDLQQTAYVQSKQFIKTMITLNKLACGACGVFHIYLLVYSAFHFTSH